MSSFFNFTFFYFAFFLLFVVLFFFFFFFSSRRRHTRWNCDWSSDVCSSDLSAARSVLIATLQWVGTGWHLTRGSVYFQFRVVRPFAVCHRPASGPCARDRKSVV